MTRFIPPFSSTPIPANNAILWGRISNIITTRCPGPRIAVFIYHWLYRKTSRTSYHHIQSTPCQTDNHRFGGCNKWSTAIPFSADESTHNINAIEWLWRGFTRNYPSFPLDGYCLNVSCCNIETDGEWEEEWVKNPSPDWMHWRKYVEPIVCGRRKGASPWSVSGRIRINR